MHKFRQRKFRAPPTARLWEGVLVAAGFLLAGIAVRHQIRLLERAYPPEGRFAEVDGVRLHYLERGNGQPVVLLHGIGCMAKDFEASGLLEAASLRHRAIAVDRPGYGYSDAMPGKDRSPSRQAELIYRALLKIGCERPVVVGHSWGAQVAISMALAHPEYIRGLVLLSGYGFPTLRPDFLLSALHAVPLIGGLLLHTVSPLLALLARPVTRRIVFGPSPLPPASSGVPYLMLLRPSQLRASMRDNLSMVPSVVAAGRHYSELKMPIAIVAGERDRLVSTAYHSVRLHRQLPRSELHLIAGAGHMIHYVAINEIMAAIDSVARETADGIA